MGTTTKGVILCSVFCLVQAIISIVLPQIYLWCSMLLTITYYFFCPPNLYVGCNVTPLSTWHFNGNHGHDFNSQITSTGKDVWLSLVGIWSFMQFYTMHFKIDLIFCCEMRICTTNYQVLTVPLYIALVQTMLLAMCWRHKKEVIRKPFVLASYGCHWPVMNLNSMWDLHVCSGFLWLPCRGTKLYHTNIIRL